MTEPQQLTIHLSGDAVVAPALRIIQQTVETVSFCLIAVDSGDMSKPAEFERARMQMRFSGDMSPWPAPGSEDTELGVLMELEVGHGEASVYARVQA
jgi:hypothetical protein